MMGGFAKAKMQKYISLEFDHQYMLISRCSLHQFLEALAKLLLDLVYFFLILNMQVLLLNIQLKPMNDEIL